MDKPELEEKNPESKFTVAYEVIERRLVAIWNAIDAIDTKTNVILGFASVVLVVLVGFFSLDPNKWQTASLVLFLLALLSYVILLILSILSYRIRGWSYKPDPATLLEHCQDRECSADDLGKWVATECNAACYENLMWLEKKSRLTNWVLYLFAAETVLLAAGLALALMSNNSNAVSVL